MRILGRLKNFRNLLKAVFATLLYRYPAKSLFVIGVTGTDGKTTTAHFIYEILKQADYRVGLISTISAYIGDKELDTGLHTTMPEPFAMQKILRDMALQGITHVILEVTSHGLDQHRALGCNFRVGVLTNITHEHTDYHGSFANYRKVKARLFRGVHTAVLNREDANFNYIKRHVKRGAQVIAYSIRDKAPSTKLIGEYNVSNVLAAAATARALGIKENTIKKAVGEFKGIEGRMEVIDEGQDFTVFVDFAHTPAALEKALSTLRKFTKRKLIAVFGSAGERDRAKRWLMAEVSGKLADYTILTAEDPRSEDIEDILNDMEKGAKKGGGRYTRVPERGEAIAYAIQKLAKKGDTVGIFGKGHEKSMAYDHIEHPWSDQEAARDALAEPLAPAVVMGAGKGTRLNASRAKILYEVAGRPMLAYTLQNLRRDHFSPISLVVGYGQEEVKKAVGPSVIWAEQKQPLGTADAARVGVEALKLSSGQVLVMNADDSAFYKPQALQKFLRHHKKSGAALTFMTVYVKKPGNLGVVKKDRKGRVVRITDHTGEEKPGDVNAGSYIFDVSWFTKNIAKVKKNPKGEYYIIDLVNIAVSQGEKVETFPVDKNEWYGVNTSGELAAADKAMRENVAHKGYN